MNGGGIHIIDLIMWLLQKKPTKVVAIGNNISSKKLNLNIMILLLL